MNEPPAVIDRFTGEYSWLSNFYRGGKGQSVEAQFQSKKSQDDRIRRKIMKLSPREAKKMGNSIPLRPDWEEVKIHIMAWLVYIKFSTNKKLRDKLIGTGKALLIEGNTWHDNYWGDCTCARCKHIKGHNTLGVILMSTRAALILGPTEE